MNIKSLVISFVLIFLAPLVAQERQKVAVCIPATEASDSSIQSLIESARRHFCRLHDVRYFILRENPSLEGEDIEWLPVGSGKTLKLFHALQENKKIFESYNYLFVIDPRMVFVAPVGDEVFGNLIAVQKVNVKGSFSSRFFGGRPSAVTDLLRSGCKYTENMSEEALINRCFKEKPPTRILSPSYAYPENWELEYSKKIIESRG